MKENINKLHKADYNIDCNFHLEIYKPSIKHLWDEREIQTEITEFLEKKIIKALVIIINETFNQ